MKWFVGTSGWSYPPWDGSFYPRDLPQREWLSFYAKHFNAVEINNSFYHLNKPQQYKNWDDMVPKNFTFVVKGSRFITHIKRLKAPAQPLQRFIKSLALQRKIAPVIFQLPPHFPKETQRLEKFLARLPKRRRYAIEFRDPSWHDKDVYDMLRQYNVAFCLFEKGELRSPRLLTANFTYVRLHGRKENYKGNYSTRELKDWHRWLKAQRKDVYVFFDNTAQKLYALDNAKYFQSLAG